ncbi:MAG: cytochrome P450 [Chloroflexi bacterium AL-W]|nr:cytochrome P450 [Chloroflexi bacterium AL-N1]NOK69916.1 cytochrome P450 [Chloroflexi bacterium AL-N10]NOK73788.1 cytochrome P450 [Chloroflexi bacterium AL-N5]NOK85448.1 cytochrome P450 [Chloroflexi bacterium AL-W]NOK91649.1 cytochrome P450 [Chloroflexi bacterium AL-N15]
MTEQHNLIPNFELFSPHFNANPYPIYAQLREHAPVYPVTSFGGERAWLITRYEDAAYILKDYTFSIDRSLFMSSEQINQITENIDQQLLSDHSMVGCDPPEHTRLRNLVHKVFTPRMIEGLQGRIDEISHQLLGTVEPQGQMDLIDDFAFPLPIIIICEMLGVPDSDRLQFHEWSNVIVGATPLDAASGHNQKSDFIVYLEQLFTQRRLQPGDDLLSSLIAVEEEGSKLSQEELYAMVILLLVAGHETTVNLIGNGVLALLQFPDQLKKLQQHPHLIESAIEEMLRYGAPVDLGVRRWAKEPLQLHNTTIHTGDLITVSLAAANRDPQYFDKPEQFDIERKDNRHLAFGQGVHYCLGAPLARLEGQIAINILLHRLPNLQLRVPPETLQWNPGPLRGLRALPLAF